MDFRKIFIIGVLAIATGIAVKASDPFFLSNNNKQVSIKLYPNPVTEGYFTINANIQIRKVEISNILGQLVLSEELEPSNSVRLDINNLETGIYLIKITFSSNTTSTERIWIK